MQKDLDVVIDANTWPHGAVPAAFVAGTYSINVPLMLLNLGTLTTPNVLSPASPARQWAQYRYLSAIASTPDLRITMPYSDLDPHQKTILSDDFGVAVSTTWVMQQVNSSAIVDGRLFLAQFATLTNQIAPTTKVGTRKSPDYVLRDTAGRWHVLECKGTQSGYRTRDKFLGIGTHPPVGALAQKQVIQITDPASKGENLAAGLAIANERARYHTQLKIIDPPSSGLIDVSKDDIQAANEVADNLTVARALSLIGLDDYAFELAIHEPKKEVRSFLRVSERIRLSQSQRERSSRAKNQAERSELVRFNVDGRRYVGRVIDIELPQIIGSESEEFSSISVSQGMREDFIQEITGLENPTYQNLESVSRPQMRESKLAFQTEEDAAVIKLGDLFYSSVILRHREGARHRQR